MSNDDPLAGADKSPALSFKGSEPGDVKYVDVSEPGKRVQQRDYDTNEPAFWPAKPGETPNPKMAVVFNGVDRDGLPVSLWAPIPSSTLTALQDAQKTLGVQIGTGDKVHRVHVKHESNTPAKNPRHADQKLYKAKVEVMGPKVAAPAPDALSDPWGSSAPAEDEPPF